MNLPGNASPDVLIVGAGPVGLAAAVQAIRHGLSVRVIDKGSSRSIHSKALVVHSRSLEIFQEMGIAPCVLESGRKFEALNIHSTHRRLARIVFEELDWQDTLHPYWLSIPQSETERCLEERLHALGGRVERNTELIDIEQFPALVRLTLKHQDGSIEMVDVPWVIGCDGAHSRTRRLLGLEMKGKADDEVFILGDVRIDWDMPAGEGSSILSPEGILLIVPMPAAQRYRIIAHMPGLSALERPEVTLKCLQDLVSRRTRLPMRLSELAWSSAFSSRHFVVSRHSQGRVFLAGDAAHIHSPVGGQGLNSGVQDAYNLVWKLALVHHGQALPGLLDSYHVERNRTARDLIAGVGMATRILTLKNPLVQKVREQAAGLLLSTARARNWMGREVAMLDIAYPDSPLAAGESASRGLFKQGGPSAGMRAPNVLLPVDGSPAPASLFDLYRSTQFTLVIFSGLNGAPNLDTLQEFGGSIQRRYSAFIQPYVVTAGPSLDGHNENIIFDPDQSIHKHYAARQACLYLVRPDQYIAYRSGTIDRDKLIAYLDRILVRSP